MGNSYRIGKSNDFWIKDLRSFIDGIKGYIGGEFGSRIQFTYLEKKKNGKALINISSDDFCDVAYYKDDDRIELDFLEYIREYLVTGEYVIIHVVEYEHAGDMEITHVHIDEDMVTYTSILE